MARYLRVVLLCLAIALTLFRLTDHAFSHPETGSVEAEAGDDVVWVQGEELTVEWTSGDAVHTKSLPTIRTGSESCSPATLTQSRNGSKTFTRAECANLVGGPMTVEVQWYDALTVAHGDPGVVSGSFVEDGDEPTTYDCQWEYGGLVENPPLPCNDGPAGGDVVLTGFDDEGAVFHEEFLVAAALGIFLMSITTVVRMRRG